MIEFKRKNFSILSSTLKGAGIGASIGIGSRGKLLKPLSDKLANSIPSFRPFKHNEINHDKEIADLDKKNIRLETKRDALRTKTIIVKDGAGKPTPETVLKKDFELTQKERLEINQLNGKIAKNKKQIDSFNKEVKDNKDPNGIFKDPTLKVVGSLTILGAAMGFLVGVGKELTNKFNNKMTVNDRLMKPLLSSLKSKGLTEDKDFTRDPKRANVMKTKICIVLSRVSGDLSVRINHVQDSKLKTVSGKLITKLPKSLTVSNKVSDRYNDIVITTISKSSDDVKLLTEIIDHFVKSGYPVYLIEVG